jgi:hypothetical protein
MLVMTHRRIFAGFAAAALLALSMQSAARGKDCRKSR